MANYGQADVSIKFSRSSATVASSATGMLPIQNYVISGGGRKLTALVQQSDAFGDAWVENAFVGVKRMEPFDLSGFYDDVAASGPDVLFGNASDVGARRYCELGVAGNLGGAGTSHVMNGRVIIESYEVAPTRGVLTPYTVHCVPTGPWATTT